MCTTLPVVGTLVLWVTAVWVKSRVVQGLMPGAFAVVLVRGTAVVYLSLGDGTSTSAVAAVSCWVQGRVLLHTAGCCWGASC